MNIFNSLQYVLPCSKCRNNLSSHLKKYPLTDQILSSRANVIKWGIDLHNVVNYYTGKPMLTYKEANNEINKLVQPKKNSNELLYFIVIIAFVIICYLIYYYLIKNKKKLNI